MNCNVCTLSLLIIVIVLYFMVHNPCKWSFHIIVKPLTVQSPIGSWPLRFFFSWLAQKSNRYNCTDALWWTFSSFCVPDKSTKHCCNESVNSLVIEKDLPPTTLTINKHWSKDHFFISENVPVDLWLRLTCQFILSVHYILPGSTLVSAVWSWQCKACPVAPPCVHRSSLHIFRRVLLPGEINKCSHCSSSRGVLKYSASAVKCWFISRGN